MLKYYIKEALQLPILFGLLSAIIGILAAYYYGKVDVIESILVLIGIILAQISVNAINDYVDYKKGIDKETVKTKFSGGSALIVEGKLLENRVAIMGGTTFIITLLIGIYLILNNPIVLPFVILGALSILLYTNYIVKIPFLSEFVVTISYLSIAIGSFIVSSSSTVHIIPVLIVALPASMSIGMALFINSIPDKKVDSRHGRRTSASLLNNNRSAYYYTLWTIMEYIVVVYGIIVWNMPKMLLIVFILLPMSIIVFFGVKEYKNVEKFERYMKINAIYSMLFILIPAISYYVAVG